MPLGIGLHASIIKFQHNFGIIDVLKRNMARGANRVASQNLLVPFVA